MGYALGQLRAGLSTMPPPLREQQQELPTATFSSNYLHQELFVWSLCKASVRAFCQSLVKKRTTSWAFSRCACIRTHTHCKCQSYIYKC